MVTSRIYSAGYDNRNESDGGGGDFRGGLLFCAIVPAGDSLESSYGNPEVENLRFLYCQTSKAWNSINCKLLRNDFSVVVEM